MKAIRMIGSMAFVLGMFVVVFIGMPWHLYHEPVMPWWLKTALFCVLGGIFVVLLTVVFEQRKTVAFGRRPAPAGPVPDMMMVNSSEVAGRRVAETLGMVRGHTIFAVWLGRDLSALVRLITGGELYEYTEMMGRAREVATGRMIEEAVKLGADAVTNVRFVTTSVVGTASELLAYGTAVKLSAPAQG